MTIKDMEWVVTLADEGEMTQTALRLFTTQPALSQCLHKVEKGLDCKLFIRTSSGIKLT